MYIIQSESGQQAFYITEQNKEFIIGRKGCDFLIENDSSVSKRHAKIILKDDALQIEDIGSKFSTFINSLKIEKNQTQTLKESDVVRFGMLNSYYKIIKKNLVVLCSGLTVLNKTKLKTVLQNLNGKLIKEWDQELCYLTVDKIVLTLKVIQAIIEGLPIVSLEYFEELYNCVKNNLIPPKEKNYLPKPSNVMLNNLNFDYNPERKNLFKNKVFVFKNKSNLDDIIKCCGGTTIVYNKNQENITINNLKGNNPQYILISDEVSDPKSKNPFDKLIFLVNQLKKRAIPQQEIPLAIMKCCIKTDCNPDFDRVGNLLKGNDNTLKPLLVGETEQKSEIAVGTMKIVPETFQSQFITTEIDDIITPAETERLKKRLSEDDDISDKLKKRKITHTLCISTQIEEDKSIPSNQSSESLSQMFKRKTPDVITSPEITKKQKILNPFGLNSSNNIPTSSTLKTQPLNTKKTLFNPFAAVKQEPQTSTSNNNNNTEIDGNVVKEEENSGVDQHQKKFLWKTVNDDGEIRMRKTDGLNELMESFKDCVVIKKLPLVIRDTSGLGSISFNESGRPNFKRFKKANPLHLQTTVIKNFRTYVCGVEES